jgi:MFS family permease
MTRHSLPAAPLHLPERRDGVARFAPSAHSAIFLTFVAFGIGFGLWSGASAVLLARTGVDPATFGISLTGFTCFYLFAMSSASPLAKRIGVKRVVIGSVIAACPTLAIVLTAASPVALICGLVVYALAAGALDAGMNAQGAALERRLGRPIMARLHGGASSGGAVGAILGSLIVSGSDPRFAAALETIVFLAAAAIVAVAASDDGDERLRGGAALDAKVLTRSLVVIGVVVGVSIACETAALAWSAPLLRTEAPKLAAFSGLGGAFFSACQAALRLNADRLRTRFSDRALIAMSLGIAACGLVVVALPFGFTVSALGFAIIGIGTGAIVPCGFALAATRPGVSTAAAISAVAFFGLFARVPSPLVTGLIAQEFSLSAAFLAIATLLASALVAVLIFIPASPPNSREAAS